MSKSRVPVWTLPTPQPGRIVAPPSIDGQFLDEIAGENVKLPLVSLVLINFNYAEFVGAAIDSVRAQDYPRLECLVIDNASTDGSREVIAKHVAADRRFKIIHSDRNEFVMGAALRGLAATSGEFVCFIDADDYLFSSFVSTHIQVHLAVPRNVAFTSSNVVEVAGDGAMLTGGRRLPFIRTNSEEGGLRPANAVPRLATVSDADYERLNAGIISLAPGKKGWFWSPGAANLYRRSVLEFALPGCRDDILAPDGYFTRFCHWLAGSALIDRPQSAYRIHGRNFMAELPSLWGLTSKTGLAAKSLIRRRHELLRAVVERADEIAKRTAAGRFWTMLDQATDALHRSFADEIKDEQVLSIFTDNLPLLVATFGLRPTLIELRARIGFRSFYRIVSRVYRQRISLQMILALVEAEFRHAWQNLRHILHTPWRRSRSFLRDRS